MKLARRQLLLKEYGEVGQMFRKLTDIRFRLLSFLPLVSGASVTLTVLEGEIASVAVLFFAIFGLTITVGLIIYNVRNDQLYNELVGRAAAIERTLGLCEGHFANRPQAWLTIRFLGKGYRMEHGRAIGLIYGAATALWLSLLFAAGLELGRLGYLKVFPPIVTVSDPKGWVIVIAVALAIGSTSAIRRQVNTQIGARQRQLRRRAFFAYQAARALQSSASPERKRHFIRQCIRLSGNAHKTCNHARFYAQLDAISLGYYLPINPESERASHLVALLTDLPPRWVFECGEGKHGRF